LGLAFVILSLLALSAPAAEDDAALLQQSAIARIDAFVEHFRKTGDFQCVLGIHDPVPHAGLLRTQQPAPAVRFPAGSRLGDWLLREDEGRITLLTQRYP